MLENALKHCAASRHVSSCHGRQQRIHLTPFTDLFAFILKEKVSKDAVPGLKRTKVPLPKNELCVDLWLH